MRLLDSVESFYDKALDVSVLNDESILVGSEALEATLFRLTPNGQYDDSYGEDGLFVPGRIKNDKPLIASRDNNVYMVHDYTPWSMGLIGTSYTNQSIVSFDYSAFVVYKLLSDGSLDSSFGNAGAVQPNIVSDQFDLCTDIVVQPDGQLLLAGTTRFYINEYSFYDDVYVSRLNMDGSIDSSFGTDGVVLLNWIAGVTRFPKIDLLNDGRIIVEDFFFNKVARLLPNENLDAEFGDNGIVDINNGDNDIGVVKNTPDNKVLLAFWNNLNGQNFYLMRLNEDGSADLSFGDNGCDSLNWMKFNIGFTPPKITVQPDGKILCVGRSNYLSQGMGITRLNSNGSIDSTFGTDGVAKIETSGPLDIFSINLQPDGKILVAGEKDLDFFVARFQNDVVVSTNGVEIPSSFQVYPNPTSDQLIINYPFSSNEEATIIISDVTGKILREEKVNSNSEHSVVNVNDLSPGIYLMTLRTESGSASTKFVKQ